MNLKGKNKEKAENTEINRESKIKPKNKDINKEKSTTAMGTKILKREGQKKNWQRKNTEEK